MVKTNLTSFATEEFTTTPSQPSLLLPYPTCLELVLSFIYYGLLWLTIIMGNGLLIVSYKRNWRAQTATNMFIVNLAISDLMVGFISIPFWLYSYSCQYYQAKLHPEAYEVYITLDVFIGCACIMILTAISLERCVAILAPIKHRAMKIGKFRTMVLMAWTFAAILAAMYPVQLKHWQQEYTMFVFLTCFMGPLGTIMVVYILIYKTAVRSKTRVYPLGLSITLHRELRVASTVALVTGIFITAWMPFFVVTLIATYDLQSLPEPPTLFRLTAFVKALHYTNSAVNPFVYGYRSLEMRKTINRLLRIKSRNKGSLDFRKRSDKNNANQDNSGSNTPSTEPSPLMFKALQGRDKGSYIQEKHAATPSCSYQTNGETSPDIKSRCRSSHQTVKLASEEENTSHQLEQTILKGNCSFKQSTCVHFTEYENWSFDYTEPVYV